MHLTLRADKDAYITNRVVSSQRMTGSNVGDANTLDLFKLYGVTFSGSTPNVELSRLLIHFDLSPLRSMIQQGRIDINDTTFGCRLNLRDVYGGQTTPSNFTIHVAPLSRSFDEGTGRDIVQYTDINVCNFVSASRTQPWIGSGCSFGAGVGTVCDYLTASNSTILSASALFTTGEENLNVDVTSAIRAVLSGTIPDEGFRIAFSDVHEADTYTYFVKRFGARSAFDASKHPSLTITYDDSIQDDTGLVALDRTLTFVLYNYEMGSAINLVSASTSLSGTSCIRFKLVTEVSGGWYTASVLGSQYGNRTGVYSASISVSSLNATVASKLQQTGSFKALPVWGSVDGTVAFQTGSYLTFYRREASTTFGPNVKYDVSIDGVPSEVQQGDELLIRVNLFDRATVGHQVSRVFLQSVGSTVRDTHVSIRDIDTGETVVPIDTNTMSSRCSSDARGMWYRINTSGWVIGHRFVIDVSTITNGVTKTYRDCSSVFEVVAVA